MRSFVVSAGALLFGLICVAVMPVPYVTISPGSTVDMLGYSESTPRIRITGAPAVTTTGSIDLPLAEVSPQDRNVNLFHGLGALLDPSSTVVVRESVYAFSRPTSGQQANITTGLEGAQGNAIVAGLVAAGRDVRPLPAVTSVASSGPAYGKLQTGDLITAINSSVVATRNDVMTIISQMSPGTTLRINLLRAGVPLEVQVVTVAAQDDPAQSRLGVEVGNSYQYDLEVEVNLDPALAGASAGLPVALAVYDKVTDGTLAGDRRVAAIGTVQPSGEVGQVTNVRQVVVASARAGAQAVLVPAGNCGDLGGLNVKVPVVKVSTVSEATEVMALIAKDPTSDQVPRC